MCDEVLLSGAVHAPGTAKRCAVDLVFPTSSFCNLRAGPPKLGSTCRQFIPLDYDLAQRLPVPSDSASVKLMPLALCTTCPTSIVSPTMKTVSARQANHDFSDCFHVSSAGGLFGQPGNATVSAEPCMPTCNRSDALPGGNVAMTIRHVISSTLVHLEITMDECIPLDS
jgi:hypothetical protein